MIALSALFSGGVSRAAPGWKRITTEDGVTVTSRDVPGRGFPTFRGVGIIHADMYSVLAVMSDIPRHTEWMYNCKSIQLIRKIDDRQRIVYSRTRAPWPVSDRDAVYRSNVVVDRAHKAVSVEFRAVKSRYVAPVKGVVRMVNLRGHFKLRSLGAARTRIEYQVDADPGGWLPGWIARIATRKLPLATIQNLRRQVSKTRGLYRARIKRWKTAGARRP